MPETPTAWGAQCYASPRSPDRCPTEGDSTLDITFIGHAGLFVETRHGTILCDPWFNPAFFASWFPFPSNENVDLAKISRPTYLYISHRHHDHFDPDFLRDHIDKNTTVLLPDHPLGLLERDLRALGFTNFVQTKNAEPMEIDGLRIMITALVSPSDGPLGDAGISIDDGETKIFNQNDSRPIEFEALHNFGPYDAHFLQFSGAIWYPMVYKYPEKMKQALGRKKRENEMARALRYVKHIGAAHVIPHAGPPCFLDPELYYLNDFDRDPVNIFPDQQVFLGYMQSQGYDNGHLMIPSSVAHIGPGSCTVEHAQSDDEVAAIFNDKRGYLDAYQARKLPLIEEIKASWPRGQVDIVGSLTEWFEPLLEQADLTSVGVGGRMLLNCGEQAVVLDFEHRKVYRWEGQHCEYRFTLDPAMIEWCILNHEEDWVNTIFLSCRFQAEREGAYNEYVYSFFKCLSEERIQYAEGYYAEQSHDQQLWECQGYRIQKRCPHLKADLTRFAHVENGVLTCTLHGWQFELATGRCLTSDDRKLFSQRIEPENEDGVAAAVEADKVPAD